MNIGKVSLTRTAAKPSAAADADLDRHFAIGMQQSAAEFAADRLSRDGSDPSGAAASLEASEKRFRTLVSQLVVSGIVVSQAPSAQQFPAQAGDAAAAGAATSSPAPSASPGQVRKAYADA